MITNNQDFFTVHLKDYQFEEWMRCPYKYYNSQILGKQRDFLNWRQMVQYVVNVIYDCYSLPPDQCSAAKVIEQVNQRWKIRPYLFDSSLHHLQVRAIVMEQLIGYFAGNKMQILFCFYLKASRHGSKNWVWSCPSFFRSQNGHKIRLSSKKYLSMKTWMSLPAFIILLLCSVKKLLVNSLRKSRCYLSCPAKLLCFGLKESKTWRRPSTI